MKGALFTFQQPRTVALPPAASPLLASVLLAIDCAASVSELAAWWQAHQPALRRLGRPELAEAVAAKDARKLHLARQMPRWEPRHEAA